MMLAAGLLGDSHGWRQVLMQEGFPCVVVSPESDLTSEYSVLVCTRILTSLERDVVGHYLKNGGAVIGYAGHLSGVAALEVRQERVDFIVSDGTGPYADTHLLDLGLFTTAVAREANATKTQSGSFAVFAGERGGGLMVALPFDVDTMMLDARAASKNFYSTRERMPSERVSLVSKGEVLHVVRRSLEFLHHERSLPYAHLWYHPAGHRSVFAFRLDTDSASSRDVDSFYAAASTAGVSMSWFLDVKSHESWLKDFALMVNQEIGLHCYEHRVYPTCELIDRDMSKATHVMQGAGLNPSGYCAPYGAWSEELARSIRRHGFEYSSEFSYAYDCFPLVPASGPAAAGVLQLPIHPISVGSLRRVGYSEARMVEYVKRVVDTKLNRNETLFMYDHPVHRGHAVVRELFAYVQSLGVINMTLGSYASWWKGRSTNNAGMEAMGNRVVLSPI
jgi:hypothetical protein